MATVKTLHPDNSALHTDVWTLNCDEAVRVSRVLDCRTGTSGTTMSGKPISGPPAQSPTPS